MPMGQYKDWDDCISKNKDKNNPEAYCGFIKNKVEGSKKEGLESACWDGYEAIGFKMKNGKKVPNCVPVSEKHVPIYLSKNLIENYKSIYNEEQYSFGEIDKDKTYDMFAANYLKTTGNAWDKDTFMYKSKDYTFFGDENGYLMVRPQAGGLYKLIGSAGNFRSIAKGMRELTSLGKPVWGMVSKELVGPSERFGFINPPGWFVKILFKQIPISTFTGSATDFKLNSDGSVTVKYHGLKDSVKYFIANKEYYYWLLDKFSELMSKAVSKVLTGLITSGKRFFRNVPLLKSLFEQEGYRFKKRKLY